MTKDSDGVNFFTISDAHLTQPKGKNSWRMTEDSISIFKESVLAAIKEKPDFIVFSGDIFEAKEYALDSLKQARAVIESINISVPWFVLMGNHDSRYKSTLDSYQKVDFIKAFEHHGPTNNKAYWSKSFSNKKTFIIGLDTSHDFVEEGWVDEEQLNWFNAQMSSIPEDWICIVFMHHPAALFNELILSYERMSSFLMEGHDKMRVVFEKYKNIKLVISGHTHTRGQKTINGIQYISVPSINSWPLMYSKFNVRHDGFSFQHIPASSKEKVEEARRELSSSESHYVEILGDSETVIKYFGSGATSGSERW